MNYQVLARKWRPQRFTEVVGQQHVLTALVNALAQGRLHHAYLFSGTRGVGKTSIARLLAKALNCDKGITPEPCGVCSSCVEIEQGRFVDLLEIDAASRTKVEDTRELLDNVQYQPARGRFKVYLIDEVHMLSRNSFNALLKTLEEPPPHVKFLLATTDPQKLPITILSRCLQFHLKSLAPELIDGQLQHILRQEHLPFEVEATAALARAADGSVRDALSLTDQALAFGNGEVRLTEVEAMLGNLNHNQLMNLVNALLSGDGEAMLAQVAELASMGPDYDHIHKELVGFWHQLALAQIVPAQPLLPYASELNRLAPLISAEHIQLFYQICLQGRKDLPFAADGRAALEMTLLRTLAFQPTAARASVASAGRVESANAKKPEPPRIAPASAPLPVSSLAAPLPPATPLTPATPLSAATLPQAQPLAMEPSAEPSLSTTAESGIAGNTAFDEADAQQVAQLYQEQDTILTQAAQFGYQSHLMAPDAAEQTAESRPSAARPQAAPQNPEHLTTEHLTTEHLVAEQVAAEHLATEHSITEQVSADHVSADEEGAPQPQAAPFLAPAPQAETGGADLPPAQVPPSQADTHPAAFGASQIVDPAAESVAKIRLLLQTRNRLRSQDLDPSEPAVNRDPAPSQAVPANNAPVNTGAVNREQATSVSAPPLGLSTVSMPTGSMPPRRTAAAAPFTTTAQNVHQTESAGRPQDGELPPLDAYADMGDAQYEDDDDLPPWLGDSVFESPASALAPVAPAQHSATPVSMPPQAAATTATTRGASTTRGLKPELASTSANMPSAAPWSSLSAQPSHMASDAEPLKPSSLLIKATDAWTSLVAQLPLGGLLRQLAMHSSLEQSSESEWQLWLKPEHRHLLSDNAQDELASVLSEQQQTAIHLRVQVGEQAGSLTPFEIEQQLYQAAIAQAKDEIETDDAVQFLISRFAAELDRDSIEPMAQ